MMYRLHEFLRYSYRPYAKSRRLSLRLKRVIAMDQFEGLLESSIREVLKGGVRNGY
jgi:hypothetical protein